MKSSVKFLLALLSIGMISAAPRLRADDTPASPAPDAAASSAAAAAAAPDDSTPPPKKGKKGRGGNPIAMLKEKLNLTDDQVAKVTDIMKAQREKGMALRQDTTLSDDDKRTQGRALMKDTQAQIRASLTPDQQKIFDTLPPMMGRGKKRAPNADAPPPPAN